MNGIFLETSFSFSTLYLISETTDQAFEKKIEDPQNLSETLLTQVQSLLQQAQLSFGGLDLIGVGIGPGNFTSTRIGLTVARTLAQVNQIPAYGISSFDQMLEGVWTQISTSQVLTLIDARRQRYYGQLYKIVQNEYQPIEHFDLTMDEIRSIASGSNLTLISATGLAPEEISLLQPHQILISPPNAKAIYSQYKKQAADQYNSASLHWSKLAPLYIRKSDAEESLV